MSVTTPAAFEDSTGTIQRLTGELEYLSAATAGQLLTVGSGGKASFVTPVVRIAAGVPSGAPTVGELPIAVDTTAVTGGIYAWSGSAWVKAATI